MTSLDDYTIEAVGSAVIVSLKTDPTRTYIIDTIDNTCTCPAFQTGTRRPCKHLEMLNLVKKEDLENEKGCNKEERVGG